MALNHIVKIKQLICPFRGFKGVSPFLGCQVRGYPWTPLWTGPCLSSLLSETESSDRHHLKNTCAIHCVLTILNIACEHVYRLRAVTARRALPGLCLMLSLEPHFEVTLLRSNFLLRM